MAPARLEPWVRELAATVRAMNDDVDAVIVEGPNDERGLRRAGFEKPVYTCATSGSLVAFAASVTEEQVVILTDFDPAGRKLNARLRQLIPGRRLSLGWRRRVGRELTLHGRRDIESMNNLFSRPL